MFVAFGVGTGTRAPSEIPTSVAVRRRTEEMDGAEGENLFSGNRLSLFTLRVDGRSRSEAR
jgi:hypothetical protein